jgi:hypothetical protein
MKTKTIILLAVSAVITLSFTFASVNQKSAKTVKTQAKVDLSVAPAGGLAIDNK